jgi:hypothetical protein
MSALEEDRHTESGVEDELEFLNMLCSEVKNTLRQDARDIKKVTVADYLKLMSLIQERRKEADPLEKEIVVRWEDPSEDSNVYM